jgi:uncharacterized protein (DUF305 family)
MVPHHEEAIAMANAAKAAGLSEPDLVTIADAVADVDGTFASMMIDHHKRAIAMAKLAQSKGEHEELRELADRIIEAQKAEVATMREHAAMHH